MLSQRGLLFFAHSRQEMELFVRSVNAMQLNGIDAELLDAQDVRKLVPILNFRDDARFPVHGAFYQGRGGIARHDAVAWGYARGADALGVDIIQNCEVAGFRLSGGRVTAIETNKGVIEAGAVGLAVAGHSGVMAAKAGFRLPVTSYALQAMVSEPVKPILHTVAISLATGTYVSQSDKGELVFGGGSISIPPTPSAAICPWSRPWFRASRRCSRSSAS
jgi:sarcosine oxidase subunit beta